MGKLSQRAKFGNDRSHRWKLEPILDPAADDDNDDGDGDDDNDDFNDDDDDDDDDGDDYADGGDDYAGDDSADNGDDGDKEDIVEDVNKNCDGYDDEKELGCHPFPIMIMIIIIIMIEEGDYHSDVVQSWLLLRITDDNRNFERPIPDNLSYLIFMATIDIFYEQGLW